MLFKILIFILLTQSLFAKPIVYFILSNDCPICHTLMNDIKSNNKIKELLSIEYETRIIDTMNQDIPDFLPFEGIVPQILIIDNNQLIGNALQGAIPSSELTRYLIDVKNYLKNKNKKVYYAF